MSSQSAIRLALSALFASTLAACGGGGSDASAVGSSPQPPAAQGASGAGDNLGQAGGGSNANAGSNSSTGGTAEPGPTEPGSAASSPDPFGKSLRHRMLTTLAGSAQLNCDNGASAPTLTLDATQFQLGGVARPVSSLASLVTGRIQEPSAPNGLLSGDQFRIQLRFDDSGSKVVYELRFTPAGQLADLVIGTPNVDDNLGDVATVAGQSFCKPSTGTAWNADPALKISPQATYDLINERKSDLAPRSLACRTPDGVAPETWTAAVRVEDGVTWSTPRASDSSGANYRYGPEDYQNHYTVIHGDSLVSHWDRVVPGGLWWGFGLTLGHDEEIVGMRVINRPGSPWTQICGTD